MSGMIVTAALRGCQILFSIIVLGLAASLIKGQVPTTTPSQTSYVEFCGGWGIIAAVLGVASLFIGAIQGLFMAALDGLSMILVLAGGITFAISLGLHDCGDLEYTGLNVIIRGNGDYDGQPIPNPDFQEGDLSTRCHQAQAATAFLFFSFACFAATAALGIMRRDGSKGSIV